MVESKFDGDNILNNRLGIKMLETNNSVYHYTDAEALYNIIKNKEFWVTDSLYLNDFSERTYIENVLDDVCEELSISTQIKKNIKKLNSKYNSRYGRFFILSFSTDDDSLTLWSEFSNFYGYDIGFNIEGLREYFDLVYENDNDTTYMEGKVIYDPKEQKRLLENKIKEEIDELNKEGKYNYKLEIDDLSRDHKDKVMRKIVKDFIIRIVGDIKYYSLFFKNERFESEKEYRFVFNYRNERINYNLEFRNKDNIILPFIKISLDNKDFQLPINSILVGAKNTIDIAINGTKECLRNYGYDNCKVKVAKSKITLRY